MKKLLLALALVLAPSLAWAQCAGVFPANTVCGNTSASPNVPSAVPFGGTIIGPGTTVVGDFATWGNTFGTQLTDTAIAGLAHGGLGGDQSAATAGQVPVFPGSGGAAVPGLPTIPLATNVSGNLATSHLNSGTGATSSTFWRGDGTWVNPATSILGANNTWTGTNSFSNTTTVTGTTFLNGNAFFGSGQPWVDVKSGANSCAAAVGNGSTDDTAAIQCQVTYMNSTFSGGTVFLPCATYKVTSTITIPGGVRLQGAGRTCSIISAGNNDVEVLNFTGGSNTFPGLRDIWIIGDTVSGALTKNLVVVNVGTPVVFENCMLWGGNFALQEDGADGRIINCFIMGVGTSGGGVISSGANFYIGDKFDGHCGRWCSGCI